MIDFYSLNKLKDPRNESFKQLPFLDQGWFNCYGKPDFYERLIKERNLKSVIEVGSWLGQSTRFFADRVDFVIAIDTWQGSLEHQNKQEGSDQVQDLKLLFDQFLSNIAGYKNIFPIRMKSFLASHLKLPKVDLIYIDGAHDYISVFQDIKFYQKFLSDDGCMCGDDAQEKDVRRALVSWCDMNNMGFKIIGNQWTLVDPKKEHIENENVELL